MDIPNAVARSRSSCNICFAFSWASKRDSGVFFSLLETSAELLLCVFSMEAARSAASLFLFFLASRQNAGSNGRLDVVNISRKRRI